MGVNLTGISTLQLRSVSGWPLPWTQHQISRSSQLKGTVSQGVGSCTLKNVLWCFSQEDIYGALVTREIQMKTKVRRKHTPTIIAKRSSVGADTERLGPSYTTGGSVNWRNSFRKPFVVPSKAGHKVALCPAILSKAYLKRNAYTCPSIERHL